MLSLAALVLFASVVSAFPSPGDDRGIVVPAGIERYKPLIPGPRRPSPPPPPVSQGADAGVHIQHGGASESPIREGPSPHASTPNLLLPTASLPSRDIPEESGFHVVRPIRDATGRIEHLSETAEDYWKAKEKKPSRSIGTLQLPQSQDDSGKQVEQNVSKLRKTLDKLQQSRRERYYDPHYAKDHPDNLAKNIDALREQHKQGFFGKERFKLYKHNAVQRAEAHRLISEGHPVRVENRIHYSDKNRPNEISDLARKDQVHTMKLTKSRKVPGTDRRIKMVPPGSNIKSTMQEREDPSIRTAYYKAGPAVYRLPSQRFPRKARKARLATPRASAFTWSSP